MDLKSQIEIIKKGLSDEEKTIKESIIKDIKKSPYLLEYLLTIEEYEDCKKTPEEIRIDNYEANLEDLVKQILYNSETGKNPLLIINNTKESKLKFLTEETKRSKILEKQYRISRKR